MGSYVRARNPRLFAIQWQASTECFDEVQLWCDIQLAPDINTVEVRHYIGGDPAAPGARGAWTTLNYLDWVTVQGDFPTATAGDTTVTAFYDFPYNFEPDPAPPDGDDNTPSVNYDISSSDRFRLRDVPKSTGGPTPPAFQSWWSVWDRAEPTAAAAELEMTDDPDEAYLYSADGYDLEATAGQVVKVELDESYWGVSTIPGPYIRFGWQGYQGDANSQIAYFERYAFDSIRCVTRDEAWLFGFDAANMAYWWVWAYLDEIHFQTSPDGSTWTELLSVTNTRSALTNGRFQLAASGQGMDPDDPLKTAKFSNLDGMIVDFPP